MADLRILHIAHDHPEWTVGGTEFLAQDLVCALSRRPNVTARFMAAATRLHRPDARPGSLQAVGKDFVLVTGAYDRFTMLRQDGTDWLDGLSRVLDLVRPHVVHLHGLDRLGAEIIPAIKRLAPECRILLTLHDYQLICANDGLMLTTDGALCAGAAPDRCRRCIPGIPADRHALRKAHLMALLLQVDRVIAPGRFLRDRMIDWGIAPERVVLIRNGVAPATEPDGQRTGRRNRFAVFGNIARHKGSLVALEAAAHLARQGADIRISLHGGLGWSDRTFRADFAERLTAASPIAQHLGPYDRANVIRLMRQADWIVVPSIWVEAAPLVILEAQAAGRPVICSGIGGMADLVRDGVDGLHVPPGDAALLADCLRRAASGPSLWKRLTRAADPPTLDSMVDAHLALYREMVIAVPA